MDLIRLVKKSKFIVISLVTFIILIGCNEQPTELGMILVKDTVVLEGISTPGYPLIEKHSQFEFFEPFPSLGVLVGQAGEFTSTSAFQVGFNQRPDTLDYLTIDDIIDAKLHLFFNNYVFGDTANSQLSFDVQRFDRFWSPRIISDEERSTIFTTWDSLYVAPANYFGQNIGSFNSGINVNDSASKDVVIDIDPQYMIDLFRVEIKDYNEDNEPIIDNTIDWGFALSPNSSSNAINQLNFISVGDDLGNLEQEIRTPYFEVLYNSKEGTIDTLRMYIEAAADFTHTPSVPADRLMIQAGENIRTSIKFDPYVIPRLAGIVKAELELFVDEDNTKFGSFGQDSVITLSLMSDSSTYNYNDSYTYYGYRNDTTSSYIFPSIGSSLERWLRLEDEYPSLILSTNIRSFIFNVESNEIYHIDRISFYGLAADDPAKRPRLTIIYSYIPEDE
jgi:hypothetical protein